MRRLSVILAFVAALCCNAAAQAQETEQWPGRSISYGLWSCYYPWWARAAFDEDGEPPSRDSPLYERYSYLYNCEFGGIGSPAGPTAFLAQIFVDRPESDFLPHLREGKSLFELQHVCGGSLISREWVLTVAHCMGPEHIPKGYKVRLGVDRISNPSEGTVYEIAEVIRHPDYENFYKDDIALIRLAAPVDIDNADLPADGVTHPISPIAFARDTRTPADLLPRGFEWVHVYGWGKADDVPGDAPLEKTFTGELVVLPNDFCARLQDYGPEKIPSSVFCTTHDFKRTCRGDSGGPVVNQMGHLVGIVSWGKSGCVSDTHPGVYTRVAAYTDWILQTTLTPPDALMDGASAVAFGRP